MPKASYSQVVIIYNPTSTSGRAKYRAERLAERLQKRQLKVQVIASERAGHAEDLAYDATLAHKKPLIVSVSGDGAYNEVVNGIMRAKVKDPSRHPVCAILPAGNSNDHRRSTRKRPLSWAILHKQPEDLTLLRLTTSVRDNKSQRYAHSYIGFGVSSQAANLLNQENYTRWQDIKIVCRTIIFFKPVNVIEDDQTNRYDSLVFMVVNHVSRVFRVGTKAKLDSASFRIFALPHRPRWRALLGLIPLIILGVQNPPEASQHQLSLPQDTLVHLDGEDRRLEAGTTLNIDCVVGAVQTLR
jgi:diacylglycerol kinase (ATP)